MVKTVIAANPTEKREARLDGSLILNISENFYSTIQGENWVGNSATFLRLQGCSMCCCYCDSEAVWRYGNPYSVEELIELWEKEGVIKVLENGQHLVLTGGSPLLQQKALRQLIFRIMEKYSFKPFIEIENECVIIPDEGFVSLIDCWNSSPKLENSGMERERRYNPEVIKHTASLPNSWFKFVITKPEDWDEIKTDFLDTKLIQKEQVVLMPEGMTREELQAHYQTVIDICVRENVRMTDRLHIQIWNKSTGC